MVKGLYTAYTGMRNEMRRMDILANNLANSDTYGFKKEGTTSRSFDEEMAVKLKDTSVYGLNQRIGDITYGVKLGENYTDWSEGSYKVTDNNTDLAIGGNGFFAIAFMDKNGNTTIKYTRDGAFKLNSEGYLVTADGDHVLNANGALNSDAGQANWVRIDPNATFSVNSLGYITQNNQIVGTIGMVDIDNYDYIEKYGENLYNLVDGGNVVASDAEMEQGALETSNVNVVNEMVNMITIQRSYEAGQKVVQSIDSTLDKAVNQVGKV